MSSLLTVTEESFWKTESNCYIGPFISELKVWISFNVIQTFVSCALELFGKFFFLRGILLMSRKVFCLCNIIMFAR